MRFGNPTDIKTNYISSPYGHRQFLHQGNILKDFHTGADFASNGIPQNIYASEEGRIEKAGMGGAFWWNGKQVRNPEIIIDHGNGFKTVYLHMSKILVAPGQSVSKGQVIGVTGMEGASTGIHLHFEIRKNNQHIDPLPYLNNSDIINSDNNQMTITVQPGWGLSHVAKAAGFVDFSAENRWNEIAKLNGHDSYKSFRLFTGQNVTVRAAMAQNNTAPQIVEDKNTNDLLTKIQEAAQKIKEAQEKDFIVQRELLEKERRLLIDEKQKALQEIETKKQEMLLAIKEVVEAKEAEVITPPKNIYELDKIVIKDWEKEMLVDAYKDFQQSGFSIQFVNWWRGLPSYLTKTLTVIFSVGLSLLLVWLPAQNFPDMQIAGGVVTGASILSILITVLQKTFDNVQKKHSLV